MSSKLSLSKVPQVRNRCREAKWEARLDCRTRYTGFTHGFCPR